MSKPDNTYRLVVFEAPDEPQKVRDLMCGVTGIHPTDAMQWVARSAPGVWPQPLAEGEVRELLDGLYELGVPAEAWRIDLLPILSPARTIHAAACLDDGLRIKGLRGEPTHWVPWDKVEIVSAGRIMLEDEYRDVSPPGWSTALAAGFGALVGRAPHSLRKARAMRIPHDPVGVAFVVRKDPRVAFRIVENQMNYDSLAEKRKLSAMENFPIFLNELCAHAKQAYVTNSTRAFLSQGDSDDYEFPSSQALLDYTTHRLLWSWYRRDRDAQKGTKNESGE